MSFEDMANSAANPKNLPVEFTFDESLVRTVSRMARLGSSPRMCAKFSALDEPKHGGQPTSTTMRRGSAVLLLTRWRA